jgi:glycosyltransferase involved in cell wall biosynthesis
MARYRVPWSLRLGRIVRKLRNDFPLWLTLKTVSALVTGTATVGRHYTENYGIPAARINTIPNWIDHSRFDPRLYDRKIIRREMGIHDDAIVILYVHRLAERKGVDRLVPVMTLLLNRFPGAVCVVAGDGPEKLPLVAQIADAGLSGSFRVAGGVPNTLLPGYFACADIFVLPSREEGFPRVLLEAMAMGVPFVSTDVGGIRDITTPFQQRFLVSPFSAEEFARKTTEVLSERETADRLKLEGMDHVRQFSLEKTVERFTVLWQKNGQ